MSILNALIENLPKMDTSIVWHFHQRKNGEVVLVKPDLARPRKSPLCGSEQCVSVLIHKMEVCGVGSPNPLRPARQIFRTSADGVEDVAPALQEMEERAKEHGVEIDPSN